MGNNKNTSQNGSVGSKGSSEDREFESKEVVGSAIGSQGDAQDDDLTTAGGRKGTFSDSERGEQGQWSPGSTQSSDQ